MKKVVISRDYNFLRDYIGELPRTFDNLGTVLHAQRNVIKEDYVEGTRLVIKSFRRIYLPNRIRYTYLYPSKAQRAFENAELLLQKGFITPRPIAYVEITRNGLIDQLFFICEYTDFQPLELIREFSSEERLKLLTEVARHTFRLHQNNIYHVDYNLGNILFKVNHDNYDIALIDNNRVQLGSVSFNKGLRNFVRLGLSLEDLATIAREYSKLWNVDEIIGTERLLRFKRNHLQKMEVKKSLKNLLSGFKLQRGSG